MGEESNEKSRGQEEDVTTRRVKRVSAAHRFRGHIDSGLIEGAPRQNSELRRTLVDGCWEDARGKTMFQVAMPLMIVGTVVVG
jgi:hypothetical protein